MLHTLQFNCDRTPFTASIASKKLVLAVDLKNKVRDKKLLCVVKANGYGHGAIAVARAVSNFSNIHFGVFSISEALELRQASITNDIMIFSKMQFDIIDDAFKSSVRASINCKIRT